MNAANQPDLSAMYQAEVEAGLSAALNCPVCRLRANDVYDTDLSRAKGSIFWLCVLVGVAVAQTYPWWSGLLAWFLNYTLFINYIKSWGR